MDVSAWSVGDIAGKISSDEIQIAINLNGYTKGARNEIFALLPAPVQTSYMGFPATTGGPLLADFSQEHTAVFICDAVLLWHYTTVLACSTVVSLQHHPRVAVPQWHCSSVLLCSGTAALSWHASPWWHSSNIVELQYQNDTAALCCHAVSEHCSTALACSTTVVLQHSLGVHTHTINKYIYIYIYNGCQ